MMLFHNVYFHELSVKDLFMYLNKIYYSSLAGMTTVNITGKEVNAWSQLYCETSCPTKSATRIPVSNA